RCADGSTRRRPLIRWWPYRQIYAVCTFLLVRPGACGPSRTVRRLCDPKDCRRVTPMAERAKWEYATVPLIVHATKQILDQWGEDGWELVQVLVNPDSGGLVAYLKRPI